MTDKTIHHYLLVFDHHLGVLIDERHFGTDSDAAVAEYSATEEKYQGQKTIEIVLVGSDSIETVRRTHANYYDGTVAESKYLAGI